MRDIQYTDCSGIDKITEEVLVAASFFFLFYFITYVAATNKSVSTRQRQQEKKIKALQTQRRAHSYLNGTHYDHLFVERNEKSCSLECCCKSV